jgi:tetratricopeptide (TPR) repeat protein
MQKKLFIAATITGLLFLFAFRYTQKAVEPKLKFISRQEVFKNKFLVQCTPDWNHLDSDSLANGISILPGWGNYQWAISSNSDSARLYFQQGINMYYSFHIAMIFWAQALSYGPNINDFAYSYTPEAFEASRKAIALSGNCTAKEKGLIKAMGVRYTSDSTISRTSLNQLYTNEMQNIYSQLSDDEDVAALYADAMMLQHPWEYWKHNGDAQPWTPRILEVLEKTLQQSPSHPGANHYYIHSVEASGNPRLALPSADRLSKLMPMVSHMVHMPSHIYIRSGLYEEGTKVNEMSLAGFNAYLALYPDVANNMPLYLIHNLHMQTACAMMGKGFAYSSNAAEACRASFDTSFMSLPVPLGNFIQYVYMTPVFNNIRFGKWDAVLAAPPVPENYVFANVLDHWARGIAFARKNNITDAKKELIYLRENSSKPDMQVVMQPFNAPIGSAKVAEKLLEGIIAEEEHDLSTAVSLLTEAVKNEDALIYDEPKDWILPARTYLGAVLLKAGSFSKAETIFNEDLKDNPNNHWSLKGLYEALKKQNKQTTANAIKKQLDKTIAMDDMKDLPVVY